MGITLKYLFDSFKLILPWSECSEEWMQSCIPSGLENSSASIEVDKISSSLVNANTNISHLLGTSQRTASAELYFL